MLTNLVEALRKPMKSTCKMLFSNAFLLTLDYSQTRIPTTKRMKQFYERYYRAYPSAIWLFLHYKTLGFFFL
jgi:hypothetical protein